MNPGPVNRPVCLQCPCTDEGLALELDGETSFGIFLLATKPCLQDNRGARSRTAQAHRRRTTPSPIQTQVLLSAGPLGPSARPSEYMGLRPVRLQRDRRGANGVAVLDDSALRLGVSACKCEFWEVPSQSRSALSRSADEQAKALRAWGQDGCAHETAHSTEIDGWQTGDVASERISLYL